MIDIKQYIARRIQRTGAMAWKQAAGYVRRMNPAQFKLAEAWFENRIHYSHKLGCEVDPDSGREICTDILGGFITEPPEPLISYTASSFTTQSSLNLFK
jgi:hypothetical protein